MYENMDKSAVILNFLRREKWMPNLNLRHLHEKLCCASFSALSLKMSKYGNKITFLSIWLNENARFDTDLKFFET
jgi:hypothetical protein